MAAYPTLKTERGSDPQPINGFAIDRAEDGTGRGRNFHASDKVKFVITHPSITAAEKTTLSDFYTANRLLAFDYTSPADSVSRSCVFAAPIEWEHHAGNRYTARVEIEQL